MITHKQLHVLLREALAHKIASGEWRAGQLIPNEVDLAHAYQLSQGTVRKALEWMVEARLVTRKRGRGTFVLDRTSNSIISKYFRIRTASGEVPDVDIEVRATGVAGASEEESAVLGVDLGASVRRITRLYSNAGRPFAWGTAVMPVKLFDLPDDDVKVHITLPMIALHCGVILGEGEQRLRQGFADVKVASALQCDEGAIVFASEALARTTDGAAAEWRRVFVNLPDGFYYSVPIGVGPTVER